MEKIKASAKESFVYLVHMDEIDIPTQMYCRYAGSKRGKRVNISMSGKRHTPIGLVAAQCEDAVVAPHTHNRTMKASGGEKCFGDKLLKKLPKEHVIIMDNAAFHKKEVLQNIAGKYSQELIFLPPYSPEYNPVDLT